MGRPPLFGNPPRSGSPTPRKSGGSHLPTPASVQRARRRRAIVGCVAEEPYVDGGPTDGPPDAIVLDIGGDVGALILYADPDWLGVEIDLTPDGSPRSHHVHTMIRRRRTAQREVIAGVYPELVAGTYTLWHPDGNQLARVEIRGGTVAEIDARTR